MTDKARFLKKKIGGPNLGPTSLNQAQNDVFPHFLEFGSYVFLENAENDSLREYLTSSRCKTHKKNLGPQIWLKRAKIVPEIRFFTIFSPLVH